MKNVKTLMTALFAATAFAAAAPAFADNDYLYYEKNRSQFISHEKAAQIAVEAIGSGEATDVEFEHGYTGDDHFDVEVRKGYQEFDVKIDARTGKVLYKRRDD